MTPTVGGGEHAVDVRRCHTERDTDLDQSLLLAARERTVGEGDADHAVEQALFAMRRELVDERPQCTVEELVVDRDDIAGERQLVVGEALRLHHLDGLGHDVEGDPARIAAGGHDVGDRSSGRLLETTRELCRRQHLEHSDAGAMGAHAALDCRFQHGQRHQSDAQYAEPPLRHDHVALAVDAAARAHELDAMRRTNAGLHAVIDRP